MREETGLAVWFTDVIFTPLNEQTPSHSLVFFLSFRSRVSVAVTARAHRSLAADRQPLSPSNSDDCNGVNW